MSITGVVTIGASHATHAASDRPTQRNVCPPAMRTAPALTEALGHASTDKRIDILRRIGVAGSISQAARAAGVSYKAAWQALETLGNLAGTPMVEKVVGGRGGGGARLTDAGRRVLDAADRLAQARVQVMARLADGAPDATPNAGLAASGLRTSMRNQFPCVVHTVTRTHGLVRVRLALPHGAPLFARITRESAQLLELARGKSVLALCKATAVQVGVHLEASEQRNLLHATVLRAARARTGGEISLRLAENLSMVGFAGAGELLRAGQPVLASVDEAGVVIAVAG